jgi:hypothetical protein
MRRNLIILLSFFQFIVSCNKENNIQVNSNRTADENQILELAYNSNYLYPTGFYQDTILNGSTYYENTVSVKPVNERKNIWIELSTNDRGEAISWSDSSNNYSSEHSVIISERETEKYFEFKRQSLTSSNYILFSRIHKSSYFIPQLDRFKKPDTIGVFNGQMVEKKVKDFIEYLWGCGSLGISNSKVIESQITEYNNYFGQYIKSIVIVYGDTGLTDSIYVNNNYFKLDKNNRILTLKSNQAEVIGGK